MKYKHISYIVILIAISIVPVILWITRAPNSLETSLKLSDSNRVELEEVLEHYSKKECDRLKLRAAKYLISNWRIYSSHSAWFEDDNKKKIDFFPPKYRRLEKQKPL